MNKTTSRRMVAVAVAVLVACNAIFLAVNGLFMLIMPRQWYDLVPGVTDTGFFNQHFVRDIGIVQVFLGAAFALGSIRPAHRVQLWAVATSWLVAHALFHLWEVAAGICAPAAILRDFPAVTLPALLGIVLTVWAWSARGGTTRVPDSWRGAEPRRGEASY